MALNCVTDGLLPNMMDMRKLLAFWTLLSIIYLPLPPFEKQSLGFHCQHQYEAPYLIRIRPNHISKYLTSNAIMDLEDI